MEIFSDFQSSYGTANEDKKYIIKTNGSMYRYLTGGEDKEKSLNNSSKSSSIDGKGDKVEEENKTESEKLLEIIKLFLSTGFPLAQLEALEKLIKEIEELIEKKRNGLSSVKLDEEIKEKFLEFKLLIDDMEKKISTKGLLDKERENNEDEEGITISPGEFKERLEYLETSIKKLKEDGVNGYDKENNPKVSTDEELQLIQKHKNEPKEIYISVDDGIPRDNNGKKFIDLMPDWAFKDLSKEDETLFRHILDDSHVSENEARALSYEQLKSLNQIMFKDIPKYGSLDEIPLCSTDINATQLMAPFFISNDDTFNQALYETIKDPYLNYNQRENILSDASNYLMQYHFDAELKSDNISGVFSKIFGPDEVAKMDIDYDDWFEDVFSYINSALGNKRLHPSLREDLETTNKNFLKLQENYNLLIETKKIYNKLKGKTMQITSTSNINKTDPSQYLAKSEKSRSFSFEVKPNSDYDPLDISFEEYKGLSKEDIDKMYPYSKIDKEQQTLHTRASSLFRLVSYSEDPLLNEVLFDMQKEGYKNQKGDEPTGVSSALLGVTLVMGLEEPIIFPSGFEKLLVTAGNAEKAHSPEYMMANLEEHNKLRAYFSEVMNKDTKPMTYEYFNTLIKKLHEDYNSSFTKEGRELIDEKEMFANLQKIVSTYEERKKENENLLAQMTSSSKPASLEETQKQKDEEV